MIKNAWTLLAFLLSSSFLSGQISPHFIITNYSIEDGLPSNECHRVVQDAEGYIWLATDRGLVRYDGYEFITFSSREGLKNTSIIELLYSKKRNTLFLLALTSEVFEFDLTDYSFSSYEYQYLIDDYKPKFRCLEMSLSEDDNLYFEIDGLGVLEVKDSVNYKLLEAESADKRCVAVLEIDSSTNITYTKNFDSQDYKLFKARTYSINRYVADSTCVIYRGKQLTLPQIIDRRSLVVTKSHALNDSILLISAKGSNILVSKEKVTYEREGSGFINILNSSSSGYYTCSIDQTGFRFYSTVDSFIANEYVQLLHNVSATSVIEDRFGNLWVSTLESGLFKLKPSLFKSIEVHEFRTRNITDLAIKSNDIYAILDQNTLVQKNKQGIKELHRTADAELTAITKVDSINLLVSGRVSFLIGKKKNFIRLKTSDGIFQVSAKYWDVFEDKYFWVSASNFGYYTDVDSFQTFYAYEDIDLDHFRVFDIEESLDSTYLFASNNGIYTFNDSYPTLIENIPEVLIIRTNAIKQKDSWYYFATQGNGLVIWDMKDQMINITTEDGLCTDNTEDVYINDRYFYILTKQGLTQLEGDPVSGFDVRCYTSKHGLPSNQINAIDERNDTLFIATQKGLVTFTQELGVALSDKPIITEVTANMKTITKGVKLHRQLNDIKYHFKTLDYSMDGDITYRYKLNGGDWSVTQNTVVDFPDSQYGNQRFEVQSQNRDRNWSESATFDFTIKTPWWHRKVTWILTLLALAYIGYLYYRNRLEKIYNTFLVERELQQLEKSALAAQMNPHFIFNCLNSVQSFIMDNQKETAMEFLGKFAKLIRSNLKASAESKISLHDEVTMLDNYLSLEQVRLNQSFEYSIALSPNIDPRIIELPPMLIQPFVENAVLHGIRDSQDRGFIKVRFWLEDNKLHVNIFDNGDLNRKSINVKSHGKSYGTTITQKRLAFINKLPQDEIFISPMPTEKGTEVKISITL